MTFILVQLQGKKEPHNLTFWATQFRPSFRAASIENFRGQNMNKIVLLLKEVLLFSLSYCTKVTNCWGKWKERKLSRLLLLAKMKH